MAGRFVASCPLLLEDLRLLFYLLHGLQLCATGGGIEIFQLQAHTRALGPLQKGKKHRDRFFQASKQKNSANL